MAIETYTLASGEKRYKAVAYLEDKTKKSKRGFKTKKEAKKWIAEQQVLGKVKPKSELTYGEVVSMWLDQNKPSVKPSTFVTMTVEIKSSFKYLDANRLITTISTNDISRLAQSYAVDYCQSKIRLGRVKSVFTYAEIEGIIDDNPFRRLKNPRQKKKGKEYQLWSTEDLTKFLEICKAHPEPIVYPAFRMLAFTGMREGELTALKWSDLDGNLLSIKRTVTRDYDAQYVMGEDGKTAGSTRIIALDSETLSILLDWKTQCPSERMFPVHPLTVLGWMKRILAKNPQIPPSTPHKLRHLHCTILLDAHANLKDVQERLGHANAQTTLNIYAHANPNKALVADIFTDALSKTNI